MLTDGQITKFQVLYKNYFGKEISRKEALKRGLKLVNMIRLTYRPITKQELQESTIIEPEIACQRINNSLKNNS